MYSHPKAIMLAQRKRSCIKCLLGGFAMAALSMAGLLWGAGHFSFMGG